MKSRKSIIMNCIAIVVALLLLVLPFLGNKGSTQYDIVFLGDSIIGNELPGYSVPELVGQHLDKTVFNGAFGGTVASFNTEQTWGSMTSNQWCLVEIADAIADKDWKSLRASMAYADYYNEINAQALQYFGGRMTALSQIDFDDVDMLVIEHGTNDYNCGRRLDNPEDLYDVSTFGGALRYSLKVMKEEYPNMQLVLLTPLYCEFGDNREISCHEKDFGYGTLDAYVQLEKQIAEEMGVPCIDAYSGSGINEENAKEYLYDGLHLSEEGIVLMSEFIAGELLRLGLE